MSSLTVTTSGDPIVLDDVATTGDERTATVPYPVYLRLLEGEAVGAGGSPPVAPGAFAADAPVHVTVAWVGSGPAPVASDVASHRDDWRIVQATQDRGAGVRIGYASPPTDRITDLVLAVMLADGWEAVRHDRGPVHARHPGRTPALDCTVWVDPSREMVVFLADLGVEPGSVARPELTELAATRTHGMDVGAVDLTPEGRVRIRQGLDVEGVEVTASLVRGALYAVVVQAETWWPALQEAVRRGAV